MPSSANSTASSVPARWSASARAAPWWIHGTKSRLASRLRDLTGVVYDGLDPQTKEQLFAERRQPRAKDKPVIRR